MKIQSYVGDALEQKISKWIFRICRVCIYPTSPQQTGIDMRLILKPSTASLIEFDVFSLQEQLPYQVNPTIYL